MKIVIVVKMATLEADSQRGNERADGAEKKISVSSFSYYSMNRKREIRERMETEKERDRGTERETIFARF